ncbi:hypothetical protein [Miltoncostaea oceani]|uniref:hypothetical protein n=1 Tax=Miltoncostaea oceani TaxID=2843216 RepID=UPI001C3E6E02|nr:hypothetical protein [Miltoncostaea oceani]
MSEWRKVPITSEGAVANHIEARVSRRYWAAVEAGRPWDLEPGAMPVARCRLTESGVLVMEPVRIERDWDSITEHRWWTDSVDCCQVGWTHDGHLVAYDL